MAQPCLSRETLQALLDSRLAELEHAAASRHFSDCAACQSAAEAIIAGVQVPLVSARGVTTANDESGELQSFLQHLKGLPEPDVELQIPAESLTTPVGPPRSTVTDTVTLGTSSPSASAPDTANIQPDAALGTSIGPYRLVKLLGRGGFGIVYQAEQEKPLRRMVAVKVIKPGMDSREISSRFEAERQALALMDHQHIARVLDAGATPDGRPYFVMELVDGLSITTYCDQHRLTVKQRLELFITVCQAVQHAHQKGIIHRDLKPSNVLVTEHDGAPDAKVIDFGIAKALGQRLTDDTTMTRAGQMLGTPQYMSPEQVGGSGDVDTRSDVYSLGALLYELLTGTTPFERERIAQSDLWEALRIVREEEPPRPSARLTTHGGTSDTVAQQRGTSPRELVRQVRSDLDWIVLKALEKNRDRRYQTVNGLAADIERVLKHEPVEACPPTIAYRLRKFVRRNAIWLGTTVAVGAALVTGTGIAIWQAMLAKQAQGQLTQQNSMLFESGQQLGAALQKSQELEGKATASERETKALLHATQLQSAAKSWRQGDAREVSRILAESRRRLPAGEQPDFAWNYLYRHSSGAAAQNAAHGALIDRDEQQLWYATISNDGRWLATCGNKGWIRVYDTTQKFQLARQINTTQVEVNSVSFSSDSSLLASAGDDGSVCLWSWPDGKLKRSIPVYPGKKVFGVAFFPGTRQFITCGTTNKAVVWDVDAEEPVQTWQVEEDVIETVDALSWVDQSGKVIKSVNMGTAHGWIDAAFGNEDAREVSLAPIGIRTKCITLARKAGLAVYGYHDGEIQFYNWKTRNDRHFLRPDGIDAVALTTDGKVICTDRGGSITVDTPTANEKGVSTQRTWSGGSPRLPGLALLPDGKQFVTAGTNGEVRRWLLDAPAEDAGYAVIPTPAIGRPYGKICFLQDPPRILQHVGQDGLIARSYPPVGEPEVWSSRGNLWSDAEEDNLWSFAARDDVIVAGTLSGQLIRLSGLSDPKPRVFSVFESKPVSDAIFYPVEDRVLVHGGGTFVAIDLDDGRRLAQCELDSLNSISLSPDGSMVAAYERETHALVLLDAVTLKVRHRCLGHKGVIRKSTFTPDSRTVVSVSEDRSGIAWDVATGERRWSLSGHQHGILHVALSPDGRTIATIDSTDLIKLWSGETGSALFELGRLRAGAGGHIAFMPDGQRLIAELDQGELAVFDGSPVPDGSTVEITESGFDFRGKIQAVSLDDRCEITIKPADLPPFTVNPEFQVNTYTQGAQNSTNRSAAMNAAGNFVIVWTTEGSVSAPMIPGRKNTDICGQRYAASGAPVGPEFLVNPKAALLQKNPSVAMNARGDFVVAWQTWAQDGSKWGVYARCFGADGIAQAGNEFRVNTNRREGSQGNPAVAMNDRGDFVIAWTDERELFARRFRAGGADDGPAFHVNEDHAAQALDAAAIGMDDAGNVVLVWPTILPDGKGRQLHGRHFPAGSTTATHFEPVRPEQIAGQQNSACALAMSPRGNFVVTWVNYSRHNDVYVQRFDSSAVPMGDPIVTTTVDHRPGVHRYPAVALDGQGGFLAVWSSKENFDYGTFDVYAQQFDAAGLHTANRYLVNSYTLGHQEVPSVAMNARGDSVIAWTSREQDGSSFGVYARQPSRDVEVQRQLISAVAEQRTVHLVDHHRGRVTVEFTDKAEPFAIVDTSHGTNRRDRPSMVHWQAPPKQVRSVAYRSDQNQVITAGIDAGTMRWNWGERPRHRHGRAPIRRYYSLTWFPRRQLAAVAEAHKAWLYDLATDTQFSVRDVTPGNGCFAATLACDTDERWLAVEHSPGTIHCFDAGSMDELFELPESGFDEYRRTELLFVPGSPLFVQVETTPNPALRCWDLECRRLVYQSEVPAWNAWTIDYRALELSAVTPDCLIRYDLKTGAEVHRLPFDGKDTAALAVSPAEGLLAVGQGPSVRFVDPHNGDFQRVIRGDGEKLKQIGFSADGKTLLALDTAGVLKFWEVAHGIPLWTWHSPEPIRRFSLSPDGRWLALTRDDDTEFLEIAPLAERE